MAAVLVVIYWVLANRSQASELSARISSEIKPKTHGADPTGAGPLQKGHSQVSYQTENQAPHASSPAQIAATALFLLPRKI